MSVGIQRLRDDAEAIRIGARDKGDDAALVDRALSFDADRRRLSGEADSLRAQRKDVSARMGAALKSGDASAETLRAESVELGERIESVESELAAAGGQLEQVSASDPEPGRPGRAGRATRRDRNRSRVGRASRARRRWLAAQAALGDRRERSTSSTCPPAPRWPARVSPSIAAPARACSATLINLFLDIHSNEHGMTEIWPPALVNADSARGTGQTTGQGRADVRRHARRPVSRADGGSAGHQHPPRRDHRRCAAADPLRRLLALLPPRGRRGRRQDARHPARPPVRQGRDGRLHPSGRLGRRCSNG